MYTSVIIMSYLPIKSNGNLSTSLFGIGEPSKFLDLRNDDLAERHIHGPKEHRGTLIIIIISAIIFVTMVSVYDVAKGAIHNYYSKKALIDPNSHNTKEDIQRTLIADNESFKANCTFAVICVVSAIIFIPMLHMMY